MSDPDARNPDSQRLSRLLGLQEADEQGWSENELADILRHQLRAPLLFDLGKLAPATQDAVWRGAGAGKIESFGDLLHHPSPPLELLSLVKEFGKSAALPQSVLPREIGTLLYYLSIAAALLKHRRWITRMDTAALYAGLQWGIDQPWADSRSRQLLSEALVAAHRRPPDPQGPG